MVLSEMEALEGAMDALRAVSVDAAYFASVEAPHAGRVIDPERFLPSHWERFANLVTATKKAPRKKANNTP